MAFNATCMEHCLSDGDAGRRILDSTRLHGMRLHRGRTISLGNEIAHRVSNVELSWYLHTKGLPILGLHLEIGFIPVGTYQEIQLFGTRSSKGNHHATGHRIHLGLPHCSSHTGSWIPDPFLSRSNRRTIQRNSVSCGREERGSVLQAHPCQGSLAVHHETVQWHVLGYPGSTVLLVVTAPSSLPETGMYKRVHL